jgi:AraC-like DNA-binding protein
MNNAIIVRADLGDMRVRASIDGRGHEEIDSPKMLFDAELHYHTLCEMFFSHTGELEITDEDGKHRFSGKAVCVAPFHRHAATVDPVRFRILFEISKIEKRGEKGIYDKMTSLLSSDLSSLMLNDISGKYVDEIKALVRHPGRFLREELSSLLKLLFINLYKENTEGEGDRAIGIENYLIVIDECINEGLVEEVDISYIAKRLHLSYRQTARIIKASYKEPLYKIINDKRLEKGKKLLTLTDKSISEISISLGFKTESYFYRLFKSKYGLTPKKYRMINTEKKTQI